MSEAKHEEARGVGAIQERIGERVKGLLGIRPRNPFSPDYYMMLSYVLVIAAGIHVLVALRFAPAAGISLYRLLGLGGSTLFVAVMEALALLAIVASALPAARAYSDKRLSFTYALYSISVTLPYLNIIFIVLGSIEPGPGGLGVKPGGLVLAAVYAVASLVIASIAGLSPFSIVEVYKARRTGEFALIDAPPGSTVRYDEGDLFRLVYYGRADRPAPLVVFGHRQAWEVRTKTAKGVLEALFRPIAIVEDTLQLTRNGRPIYSLTLKPLKPVTYGKPDTEIHVELIVPGEGGKTIRKIIVQRPGGVKLSSVLKDVVPQDLVIQRILRIENGRYQPVKDPEKEIIKPKTLNRFVVETLPAGGKPTPAIPAKAKPSPGIAASAPAVQPVTAGGPLAPESGLVARVKRLIEEYSELREDLW